MYDINKVREDFPILSRTVYNKPLIYLDNGATTQKPRQVVEALVDEYYNVNANVHRGVHFLSQRATDLHEEAREKVRGFINAAKVEEIVFTRGTTESINLVAQTFCESQMKAGDEVIISCMEHHSNIVPWQLQAEKRGIVLKVIPMTDDGVLQLDEYERLFTERTKLVSCTQVSNVLGTLNPVKEMIVTAHRHGVPFLVDGAQSAPHLKIDVQEMDCDFFALSGHKMMIATVTFEKTTFEKPPLKFEAGTPDYVATTGLARAIDYLNELGMENLMAYEQELTRYAMEKLSEIPNIHIYGPSTNHDAVISFNMSSPHGGSEGGFIHHMDMGTLLDRLGIAVRTGHHCAQPLMDRLGRACFLRFV